LAHDLYRASRDRVYIPPITETHPECDLSDAYAIASAVNDLKIASGRVVKGHKIGLTSQVMRDLAGGEGPDFGTIFDDMFIAEESSVSTSLFNTGVAVEIEILLCLGSRCPGRTSHRWTSYGQPTSFCLRLRSSTGATPGEGPAL
jgi:2-keto-4-pentenoate hydratase